VGWLETRKTAIGGGLTNRTGRIRSQGAITKAGRNCRRGTAGRSSSDTVDVPGVVHAPECRHQRAPAECELVHVRFADKYRAGRLQFANDFGILGRNTILEDVAARSCFYTCGVEKIFHRDWNSMKRP